MRACWCTMGNTDACNNCHNNHDTMLASEKSLNDWLSKEECKAWDNNEFIKMISDYKSIEVGQNEQI